MKKLRLSQEDKAKLLKEFEEKLSEYNPTENSLAFEKNINSKPENKLRIMFTPEAYICCEALVKGFSGEVGWHGLIRKTDENSYLVYKILVYPQVVSAARTYDQTTTNDWYDSLSGEAFDALHFQAHSHVNMSTTPSTTDTSNQMNIVKNMGGSGFYLFQIWNKSGDINSFFYDLDNNLFYDRNDVEISIVLPEDATLKDFMDAARDVVEDIKYTPPKQQEVTLLATGSNFLDKTPTGYEIAPVSNPYYWKNGSEWDGDWN